MKKANLFSMLSMLALFGLFQLNANAQTIIAQWTFPEENGMADGGISPNDQRFIETAGGTSEIDFKNGATTKAARATGWNNGEDSKMWTIHIQTRFWVELNLSSKISSGGENPGPRDFKVQYKIEDGSWIDVENSDFQTANDWTTGVLDELPLPYECGDQNSIEIRWIMTSDTAVDGSIVNETGISKIDDIFVTGEFIEATDEIDANLQVKVYPNPCSDIIHIKSASTVSIDVYNLLGRHLHHSESKDRKVVDVSEFEAGSYLFRIKNLETQTVLSKVVIVQ